MVQNIKQQLKKEYFESSFYNYFTGIHSNKTMPKTFVGIEYPSTTKKKTTSVSKSEPFSLPSLPSNIYEQSSKFSPLQNSHSGIF